MLHRFIRILIRGSDFFILRRPSLTSDFAKEVFPMRLILLDTDIGNDMDDMQALAYLLAQPGADLLGVTTVTGEAIARA